MKKLILVLGPRSSGTRIFTKLLISAGVVGDGDNGQRLARISPYDSGHSEPGTREEAESMLQGNGYCVLRRSFPHGMGWPDPMVDAEAFKQIGSDLACAFLMQRDVYAMCQSMVIQGHEPTFESAFSSLNLARTKLSALSFDLIPVSYELLNQPLYVMRLIEIAGIDIPLLPDTRLFKNENAKHYTKFDPCAPFNSLTGGVKSAERQ